MAHNRVRHVCDIKNSIILDLIKRLSEMNRRRNYYLRLGVAVVYTIDETMGKECVSYLRAKLSTTLRSLSLCKVNNRDICIFYCNGILFE